MDNNKNLQPQHEDGHKNERREGGRFNRQGGERREESGQRISVRPGNFNPPPRKGNTPQAAPVSEVNGRKSPKAGIENGESRQNRSDKGHNRRGKGNRVPTEVQTQKVRQATDVRTSSTANTPKTAQKEDRRDDRGRNRHDHRKDRRPEEQKPKSATEISSTLQNELDAEFGTPTLSASFNIFHKDPKKEEIAVSSEEFAVDIATAAYLVEDVPCGFPVPDGKAVPVVGVRFRGVGKMYFFAPGDLSFRIGDEVLVDTARGEEIGEIVMLKRKIAEKNVIQPLRPVLRHATDADKIHDRENRAKEAEALKICAEKIKDHRLEMALVDAQYTFDNSKLLFYFTSEGRVDFRDLVRDLAGIFRTRIELRQIGIRDESRLIGGIGMCGRPFCCSTFLSDFGQVSVKMAKEQGLSINTSKISGCCGRLMCCLRYEHETYAEEIRLTPKKDALVSTPDGNGTVTESSPLAGTVKVKLESAPEDAPKIYHRDAVTVLGKAKNGSTAAENPKPAEEGD